MPLNPNDICPAAAPEPADNPNPGAGRVYRDAPDHTCNEGVPGGRGPRGPENCEACQVFGTEPAHHDPREGDPRDGGPPADDTLMDESIRKQALTHHEDVPLATDAPERFCPEPDDMGETPEERRAPSDEAEFRDEGHRAEFEAECSRIALGDPRPSPGSIDEQFEDHDSFERSKVATMDERFNTPEGRAEIRAEFDVMDEEHEAAKDATESSVKPTDEAIAENVRDKVAALNAALEDAGRMGIHVELTDREVMTWGVPGSRPHFIVERISREIR